MICHLNILVNKSRFGLFCFQNKYFLLADKELQPVAKKV
jgi:hypothetical protein